MEKISGKKANEFGPTHNQADEKALCNDGECECCARRIFAIHVSFFREQFKELVAKQHGADFVCRDASCSLCHGPVVCPGCNTDTGAVRTGVLACEIFQRHPGNAVCATSLAAGPLKQCSCKAHVRPWLLCSLRCQKESKFARLLPPNDSDLAVLTKLYDDKTFAIPEMGPLLVTTAEVGPNVPKESLATACDVCGKLESDKFCGRCKKVRYCGASCQRSHWPQHKGACTPNAEKSSGGGGGGIALSLSSSEAKKSSSTSKKNEPLDQVD